MSVVQSTACLPAKMYDSPNEIVIVGDELARNEKVFVVVKDLERMKNEASKGAF